MTKVAKKAVVIEAAQESETGMRAVRYRTEEGVRNGLLIGEGPKWIRLILPDCRGLRITEVPVTDRKFISDIDVPVKRALDNLKVHAQLVGCLKGAAEALGIKPIEPPRQEELESPTPTMMKQEFENMARNIPKSKKATDKKPRAKREPKVGGAKKDGSPGPTVRAYTAGKSYAGKLEASTLNDRAVSRKVKDAMIAAAPDAAPATIATQFSRIKRELQSAAA